MSSDEPVFFSILFNNDLTMKIMSFLPLYDAMAFQNSCKFCQTELIGIRWSTFIPQKFTIEEFRAKSRQANQLAIFTITKPHLLSQFCFLLSSGSNCFDIFNLVYKMAAKIGNIMIIEILLLNTKVYAFDAFRTSLLYRQSIISNFMLTRTDISRFANTFRRCYRCSQNIGVLQCFHASDYTNIQCIFDNDRQFRYEPRRRYYCIDCISENFCHVCDKYQCSACDTRLGVQRPFLFILIRCMTCQQQVCKYLRSSCYEECQICSYIECHLCIERKKWPTCKISPIASCPRCLLSKCYKTKCYECPWKIGTFVRHICK